MTGSICCTRSPGFRGASEGVLTGKTIFSVEMRNIFVKT
jgi:hypothetical protein